MKPSLVESAVLTALVLSLVIALALWVVPPMKAAATAIVAPLDSVAAYHPYR